MPMKISTESIVGFLGPGTELTGGLHFSGTLRVDGKVTDGELSGRTLLVGEFAEVHGRIEVDVLSVQGRVGGEVHVRRRLEVLPGGCVEGKVKLEGPCLTLQEGGSIDGTIDIVEAPRETAAGGRETAPSG